MVEIGVHLLIYSDSCPNLEDHILFQTTHFIHRKEKRLIVSPLQQELYTTKKLNVKSICVIE